MTVPDITVEISFDDVSDTTPTWTDVSVYVDSYSITRGRNHELNRIDAGQCKIILENTDGRFTPGKAAGAYSPNVVPHRRVRITAVWSAVTYRRFLGYVEGWRLVPSGHPDRFADVEVTAVDAFGVLSRNHLFAAYAEQIFQDVPSSYIACTEGKGANYARDFAATTVASVPLLRSKSGSAASDFGADAVLRYGDVGTSLGLNPASTSVRADILDCSTVGAAYPISGGLWTFEAWINYEQVPGNTHYLLRHQSKHGTGINGFAISIHTDGKIYVSSGSEVDFTSTAVSIVDQISHHVALVYTTGGSFGHALLYLDGVLVADYTLTASIFPFGEQAASANTFCCVGGVRYASTIQDGGMRARLGHVAFYADDLTANQVAQHYSSGYFGSPEDEVTRIGAVLDMLGWDASLRSLESARANTLQPRDWADGSPGLNPLTDSAAAAGGVLFMATDSKVTYQNRSHRYNRTVDQTFDATTAPEADGAEFAADNSEIRNVIKVTRGNEGGGVVRDSASASKYGEIWFDLDVQVTLDSEALDAASWALYLYADPAPRVSALTWKPSSGNSATASAMYPKLLDLEFGDRITISNTPTLVPDGPLDQFVEKLEESYNKQEWSLTLTLSPATKYDISVWDTGEWGGGGSPALYWGY